MEFHTSPRIVRQVSADGVLESEPLTRMLEACLAENSRPPQTSAPASGLAAGGHANRADGGLDDIGAGVSYSTNEHSGGRSDGSSDAWASATAGSHCASVDAPSVLSVSISFCLRHMSIV